MVPASAEDWCRPDSVDSDLERHLLRTARFAAWRVPCRHCGERKNLVARPHARWLETLACRPSRYLRHPSPGAQVGSRNRLFRSLGFILTAVH